jgi:hypothetical protein
MVIPAIQDIKTKDTDLQTRNIYNTGGISAIRAGFSLL